MEQAEQICDHVCIIARGKKLLDGRLAELKRAAAAEGRIALGFADAAAAARATAGPLADAALVSSRRDLGEGIEVELAGGATADQLLAALVTAEVSVRRFEVVTPSLHQIFVDQVGVEGAAIAERVEAGAA
jgi:ABC-2 type transport system ATP-binding protein